MQSEGAEAFRLELRQWLAANVPDDLKAEHSTGMSEATRVTRLRVWQRALAEARYIAIGWPAEHGGRGAGIPEQIAYVEEMARAGAPEIIGNLGIGIAGPPIMAYGTEEQKRRFLPRILDAGELWCFGFSEPGAGSDLASLRTQAVLDGDDFVVSGQKVWTTLAHHADWCMLLCRTDPDTRRAKGVSCLLVDMKSPGIEVRPLRQITGEAEFNEVFFENVRVPRANLPPSRSNSPTGAATPFTSSIRCASPTVCPCAVNSMRRSSPIRPTTTSPESSPMRTSYRQIAGQLVE
jgi:alkylation response protein AidB-like acyl-CoA dehydrogenase